MTDHLPLPGRAADEALLRIDSVMARTGLDRSTLYAAVSDGRFPAPLKRGAASVWVKGPVDRRRDPAIAEDGAKHGTTGQTKEKGRLISGLALELAEREG